MWQAYFDDSGGKRQGRWMVIAGLLGETSIFTEIAHQWRLALGGPYPPGRVSYFKMDDAITLNGEFRHWRIDHRDQKVQQLASVINRGDVTEIAARIDVQAFEKVAARWCHIKPRPGERERFHSMDQPYLMLLQRVLAVTVAEAWPGRLQDPLKLCLIHMICLEKP